MENGLLYTLSTIPQTVAAAFGVLAAFILYRLQSDGSTMWEDARTLVSSFRNQNRNRLNDLLGSQQYGVLLGEAEALYANVANRPPIGSAQDLAYKRLNGSLAARRKIVGALRGAFLVTAAVITLCVVEIPLAHRMDSWIALAVLLFSILGLALCLWLYWLLIRAALGPD